MDLYSSTSTQRPKELSGSATPPPPKAAITERQQLGQTRAEKVVPESKTPSASASGSQTETVGQTGDGAALELLEQPQKVPEPVVQHQTALENPEQPQPTQSSKSQNLQKLVGPPRNQLEVLD
jgi:hypothetical protein